MVILSISGWIISAVTTGHLKMKLGYTLILHSGWIACGCCRASVVELTTTLDSTTLWLYSKPFVCFPSALGRKQVLRIERGIARPILYQETLPLDDRRRCYKVSGICYATSLLYEFTTTSGFLEGKKKNVDLGRKPYTHCQLTEKRKCLMGRQSDKPLALTQLGQCLDVVSESRRRLEWSETQNYF